MTLLYDEDVWPAIIKLIDDAEEWLILVSPYNDFSTTLRDAVTRAVRRDVEVTAVCREDRASKERSHWTRLTRLGVQVLSVERLHAKIYLNEAWGILGSMNLYQESAVNSKEAAVALGGESHDNVLSYVIGRLIEPNVPDMAQQVGHCIRCASIIPYNSGRPLCDPDYEVWSQFRRSGYRENHCHRCGREAPTSYATPLCHQCS